MALKVKDIEQAIIEKRGNISNVARSLRVSRQAIYNKIKTSPKLQQALEDAREDMLDEAENVLYERALAGQTAELIFFLKTQGKRRGYTERQEIEHDGQTEIVIKYADD